VAFFGAHLRTKTIERLVAALRSREPELQAEAERLGRDAARLRAALDPLLALERLAAEAEPKIPALGNRFGASLPAGEPPAVLQPLPRPPAPAEPDQSRAARRSERRA
jgi:hypothetical protein